MLSATRFIVGNVKNHQSLMMQFLLLTGKSDTLAPVNHLHFPVPHAFIMSGKQTADMHPGEMPSQPFGTT